MLVALIVIIMRHDFHELKTEVKRDENRLDNRALFIVPENQKSYVGY